LLKFHANHLLIFGYKYCNIYLLIKFMLLLLLLYT